MTKNMRVTAPLALAIAGAVCGTFAASVAVAAPEAPNGETLFRQRCQQCHSATPGRPSTLGPSLVGVVGRKAASTPFNYSPALKASGLTWTRANMDRYLSGPARMVPGTRMVVVLPDAAQRAALITYLAGQR
ncbi:MAG TPA: c-type cytochrome [Novosphingobium sp.]